MAAASSLYSVPSAVVFRAWAAHEDPKPMTRRLILKNGADATISFRLTLPRHAAFTVSGSLVQTAAHGDEVCNISLPAGGSTALTVTLHREHADEIECTDELCVRMPDGWLHVPLVALRLNRSCGRLCRRAAQGLPHARGVRCQGAPCGAGRGQRLRWRPAA